MSNLSCSKCQALGNQLSLAKLKCNKTGEKITPQDYCSLFVSRRVADSDGIILGYPKKLENYDKIRGF